MKTTRKLKAGVVIGVTGALLVNCVNESFPRGNQASARRQGGCAFAMVESAVLGAVGGAALGHHVNVRSVGR